MLARTLFGPEHETFRDSVKRFMDEEVKPHEERWQEQGYVDREMWRRRARTGSCARGCPSSTAARAPTGCTSVIMIEERRARTRRSLGFGLHSEIVAPYILHYGNGRAQEAPPAERWRAARWIGAIAMSEPGAGSDLQAIQTSAVRDGDVNTSSTAARPSSPTAGTRPGDHGGQDRSGQRRQGHQPDRGRHRMQGFDKGQRLKKMGIKAQDTSRAFLRTTSGAGQPTCSARRTRASST